MFVIRQLSASVSWAMWTRKKSVTRCFADSKIPTKTCARKQWLDWENVKTRGLFPCYWARLSKKGDFHRIREAAYLMLGFQADREDWNAAEYVAALRKEYPAVPNE